MKVFKSVQDWLDFRTTLSGVTLGFVPTMGALHAGHVSLVEQSVSQNEKTLVSIFVNPTQFNDPSDLQKYPRTFESDVAQLEKAGADFLFYPNFEEMYPDQYRYKLSENEFSRELCGKSRPGHFDGVLTVVMKLLQLAQAKHAYFGEKDFQQLELIRGMAEAFFVPTRIVAMPTVRESDGLAMSSRNLRLSPPEREIAPLFYKLLSNFTLSAAQVRQRLEENGFKVDYVEETKGRRFGAAWLGSIRLIDNLETTKSRDFKNALF
jgi:pantoate--beta-alanine ligase